jgi:hypothetical protein
MFLLMVLSVQEKLRRSKCPTVIVPRRAFEGSNPSRRPELLVAAPEKWESHAPVHYE